MRGCILNIFSEKDRLDCTCFDRNFCLFFFFLLGLVQTDNTCGGGGGATKGFDGWLVGNEGRFG